MLATDYAKYYGIAPQGDDETDSAFRGRVSGILRGQGRIIEAHEAHNDKRYDDSENAMTGIMGAVAGALYGTDYGSRGERQVGDDIAIGALVRYPKPEPDPMMLLLAAMMGR